MRRNLLNLKQSIDKNLCNIQNYYRNIDNLLIQINILLDKNVEDDKIKDWLNANKYSLDITNEYLRKFEN